MTTTTITETTMSDRLLSTDLFATFAATLQGGQRVSFARGYQGPTAVVTAVERAIAGSDVELIVALHPKTGVGVEAGREGEIIARFYLYREGDSLRDGCGVGSSRIADATDVTLAAAEVSAAVGHELSRNPGSLVFLVDEVSA